MTYETTDVFCSRCSRETTHEILFNEYVNEVNRLLDAEYGAYETLRYQYTLYKCAGCNNVVMYKGMRSSEVDPRDYGDWCENWYPPKAIRNPPNWYRKLPQIEWELLDEILVCLNSSCLSVSAMGLRALLDMFIVRKIDDEGSFKQKLEKMAKLGFLSANQLELIEPVLELGHAASHRGYVPEIDDVVFTLDVILNVLHQDLMASNIPDGVKEVPKRN